jgi:hypothetical protein
VALLLLLMVAGAFLLLRKERAVVDGCFVWVAQDTHCTALVYYRDGRQVIRFGAEVGVPPGGGSFLYVDLPDRMYTDDGHGVPTDEYALIKQRVSRGLKQLGIAHEFSSPETASDRSR